jgi:hypothetical protein
LKGFDHSVTLCVVVCHLECELVLVKVSSMIKEIKINSDSDVFDLQQGSDVVASDDLLTMISALDRCGGHYCILVDVQFICCL